jgi:hypothetical protein
VTTEQTREPRRRGVVAAWMDGLLRVATAPVLLVGIWTWTVIVAVPGAMLLHEAIASDLGNSMAAADAAGGVNWSWWQEFAARQPALAQTFRPSVIGFAAVLRNTSDLLDGRLPLGLVSAAVVMHVLGWSFLLGGALDRLARRRAVGAAAFFAACGVHFWRFLRLGALALLAYAFLFLVVHAWLFDELFPAVTRDLASERGTFAWRVVFYAIFLVLLSGIVVVFDYARVRAVVEDRRSMVAALGAGARFIRRHLVAVSMLFGLNVLLLGVLAIAYGFTSPGAGGHVGVVLAAGQGWVVARIAARLACYATATALFQQRLAHAGYTALPPRRRPEAPIVEAITGVTPAP